MTNEDFFRLANEVQIQTVVHFDKRQNSYDDFKNLIAVSVDKYANKDLGIQQLFIDIAAKIVDG